MAERKRRTDELNLEHVYINVWIVAFRQRHQITQLLSVATAQYIAMAIPKWWYFCKKEGACLPSEFFSTSTHVSINS